MASENKMEIATLGGCRFRSPLSLSTVPGDGIGDFIPDTARVRYQVEFNTPYDNPDILFEKAGPREKIFFDPPKVRAAIVSCGGLCPGINDVIRSICFELKQNYHAKEVLGIRYGYQGLNPAAGRPPLVLTEEAVDGIHLQGGTVLGSSRGAQPVEVMTDFLESRDIDVLFCIGGDGTQRGAHAIAGEVTRRGLKKAIVGIPKTIDNDIPYVQQTFGYLTSIERAHEVLNCAHIEAKAAINGIGLVKVMGRDSGFIAAGASLASQDVDFTLIPEVKFALGGENGLLSHLERRLARKPHALIVVAEGAGQELMPKDECRRDASGNILHNDIGPFLLAEIKKYFREKNIEANPKYIDPSYIIRSVPANCADSIRCDQFARHAVHAAMAGKTDVLIGLWNERFIHVPLAEATCCRRYVQPESELWESVISVTGQPRIME